MNKVPPKAGQVWEGNHSKAAWEINFINDDDWISYGQGSYVASPMPKWQFITSFKFIPQNDLEWLAVKVESLGSNIKFIARRGSEYLIFETKPEHTPGLYTSQEHQNMRFELGLDEKPKPTKQDIQDFMDGATKILKHYKDTKMIDLSPFKIGDKLITRDNDRVKVVFLSESQMITEDEDGSGCLNMYKLDGTCIDRNAAGNFCSISDIVSRHDPRHWLSQLPDAGLFVDKIDHIAANDGGKWWAYIGESNLSSACFGAVDGGAMMINCLKMPKLTGDEWKLSKISIVELRAWQEQNK